MKYIFILGRIPTLSTAEVLNVFRREKATYQILKLSEEVLIADLAEPIKNEQEFLDKLGGTIKIIEVLGEVSKVSDLRKALNVDELMDKYPNIKQEVKNIPFPKFYWGLSVYFLCKTKLHIKQKIAKEIKSYLIGAKEILRERQIRCRIVTPPPHKLALDAPAVAKDGLIKKGGEIAIAVDKEKVYFGKTLAVQDFKFYGLRDYGRPARDMKVGMMPPKLAQIMLNLSTAKKGGTILDPFCGTGVLLQEALLMGYKVIGSDKSEEAIKISKKNLEWLALKLKDTAERQLDLGQNLKLFHSDVSNLAKFIAQNSVDAVVSEGTLGPRYSHRFPTDAEAERNFKNLETLHLSAFKVLKNILISRGRIVITFPVYQTGKKKYAFAPFIDKITEVGYSMIHPLNSEKLPENTAIRLSERKTIIYDRPDQIVGREIVIFIKK